MCECNEEKKIEGEIEEKKEEKVGGKIEYDKTYYFDKSGLSINEPDLKTLGADDIPMIRACCRLQLPKGFKFHNDCPGMCFNLSNLHCIKSPIMQKVKIPNNEYKHPVECDVVAGYEIRAVGDIEFSVSAPLCPKDGCCFPVHSHTCCAATAPVNKVISYTCCPKPCPAGEPCIEWQFACFRIEFKQDACGPYLQVNMGVALEYTGVCECDEE